MKDKVRPLYRCSICGTIIEESVHCGRPCVIVLGPKDRVRLSKLLSGILRHFPHRFGVKLDEEGWARIDAIVEGIRERRPDLRHITSDVLIAIAQYDPKERFEILNNKIRARYGHTVRVKISYEEDTKSKVLYHGTVRKNLKNILSEGLKPMKRQWVHLSTTIDDALTVGKRHGHDVVILKIDCNCLRSRGIKIYIASKSTRLVQYVPSECIFLL
ncbi:MAG TPA: RNA 2'-phosphotransferase [Thermoprotei archaeon]|nr:RNA 2'-phosphotransferase [Thermoprotei archaeon]